MQNLHINIHAFSTLEEGLQALGLRTDPNTPGDSPKED